MITHILFLLKKIQYLPFMNYSLYMVGNDYKDIFSVLLMVEKETIKVSDPAGSF